MSIHWQQMKRVEKIEAIKAVYKTGMTARQIAEQFDGANRYKVLAVFYRNRKELADCALPPHGCHELVPREKKPTQPKLKAIAFNEKTGPHQVGRPLMLLEHGQCRWAVNDAQYGELHLFCGTPTQTTYCQHHTSRAYREQA